KRLIMASSSPFSRMWNHDVFISFRGEDTRKTFVDHLYSALVQCGIHTYKDDVALPRDSSWYLDELAHIMKCMGERGLIVLPIFYDVDPSDVRKQNGKYGEAFAKHEIQKKDKVESWRKALVDAGNLAGWEVKHVANGYCGGRLNDLWKGSVGKCSQGGMVLVHKGEALCR
nr:TMV resistance protein N-like [Tanacetum cinerariifolium]